MNVYDQASRYSAKLAPVAFLRRLSEDFVEEWTFVQWTDTRTMTFPNEPDRICDTIAECVPADVPTGQLAPRCLAFIEFETEPDYEVIEREGEYGWRLRRELRFGQGFIGRHIVYLILVNLTGNQQVTSYEERSEALGGAGMAVWVKTINLSQENAAATIEAIEHDSEFRCLLPWVPLMQGGGEKDIIEKWK